MSSQLDPAFHPEKSKTLRIRLTVDKVSEVLDDHVLKTEPFSLPITKLVTMALQMKNGEDKHKPPSIIITLHFKNCSNEDKTFWIKVIIDAGNEFNRDLHFEGKSYRKIFVKANAQFSSDTFYCWFDKKYWIKDDNKLCVLLQFKEAIPQESACDFIERGPEEERKLFLTSLSNDDFFKDVKFVIGEQSLMVHKAVIANRSKVFRAMFNHATKEKTDGVIEIKDSNFEVFETFVQYLYTNEINDDEMTEEMLYLADKYDVQCLRTKCEKIVCRTVDEANAIDYLIKADAANFQFLKKRALEVISDYLKEIRKSEEFKQLLVHPQLLEEIYNVYFDQDEIIECNLLSVPVLKASRKSHLPRLTDIF